MIYLDAVTPAGGGDYDLTGAAKAIITNKPTVTLEGLTSKGYYAVYVAALNSSFEVGQTDIVFQTE